MAEVTAEVTAEAAGAAGVTADVAGATGAGVASRGPRGLT